MYICDKSIDYYISHCRRRVNKKYRLENPEVYRTKKIVSLVGHNTGFTMHFFPPAKQLNYFTFKSNLMKYSPDTVIKPKILTFYFVFWQHLPWNFQRRFLLNLWTRLMLLIFRRPWCLVFDQMRYLSWFPKHVPNNNTVYSDGSTMGLSCTFRKKPEFSATREGLPVQMNLVCGLAIASKQPCFCCFGPEEFFRRS